MCCDCCNQPPPTLTPLGGRQYGSCIIPASNLLLFTLHWHKWISHLQLPPGCLTSQSSRCRRRFGRPLQPTCCCKHVIETVHDSFGDWVNKDGAGGPCCAVSLSPSFIPPSSTGLELVLQNVNINTRRRRPIRDTQSECVHQGYVSKNCLVMHSWTLNKRKKKKKKRMKYGRTKSLGLLSSF